MLFDRDCCESDFRQNMAMGPMMQQTMPMAMPGQMLSPVIEPTVTQVVQRDFVHEVPHVCPKHTHIINRHIFRHTYTPQYSCSEENQCVNVNCGSCCNF